MNSKKIILIIVVSCICLIMLIIAFLLGNKTKYYMNSGNIEIYGDYDKNDLDDEFFGVGNANIVFKTACMDDFAWNGRYFWYEN